MKHRLSRSVALLMQLFFERVVEAGFNQTNGMSRFCPFYSFGGQGVSRLASTLQQSFPTRINSFRLMRIQTAFSIVSEGELSCGPDTAFF